MITTFESFTKTKGLKDLINSIYNEADLDTKKEKVFKLLDTLKPKLDDKKFLQIVNNITASQDVLYIDNQVIELLTTTGEI